MLGPEKDLERKLREAVMAVQLEHRYAKRTILERYLNTIYFGNGAYGVQAAAHRYFSRDVGDLDLAQSALLAGLIRSPETYNPFEAAGAARSPGATRSSTGSATLRRSPAAEVAAARAQPLGLAPPPTDNRVPGAVLRRAGQQAGPEQHGVRRHRGPAPAAAARRRPAHPHHAGPEDAGTGRAVRRPRDLGARDGSRRGAGRDRARPPGTSRPTSAARTTGEPQPWAQVDLADIDCYEVGQGCRQAGSTFKPFVLAAALDAGVPLTRTYDAPASLTIPQPGGQEPWLVNNYDGSGRGEMNLTEATVSSVNTVYAQLVMDLGAQPVVDLAAKMGIRSPLVAGPVRRARAATARPSSTWRPRTRRSPATASTPIRSSSPGSRPVTAPCCTRRRSRRTRVLSETTARTITGVLAAGRHPRHRGQRADRPAGRGQDRDERRMGRRLVRRVHPRAGHRGLGRLPRRKSVRCGHRRRGSR